MGLICDLVQLLLGVSYGRLSSVGDSLSGCVDNVTDCVREIRQRVGSGLYC